MKAGSPDPVMTRQLCAACGAPTLSTAAGVPAVKTVARTAQTAAAATAVSRRVERRLRRIGCPFSPGQRATRAESTFSENVSGTVYHDFRAEVKTDRGNKVLEFAGISETFRNMLEFVPWTSPGAPRSSTSPTR